MSRAARFTLVASIVFSGLTIWGVHYLQEWERNSMYQGVLRDDERRQEKMRQRQAKHDLSLEKQPYDGVHGVGKLSESSR